MVRIHLDKVPLITKLQTQLLTLQKLNAAPRVVVSSTLDVTTKLSASLFIRLGRQTTSAFTAGVNFRVEAGVTDANGNTIWFPYTTLTSALGSSVAQQSPTTNAPAGATTIPMTTTTNLAQGDVVFIENATLANSEFGRLTIVNASTSIVLETALLNAQPTTSTVYDQAEIYSPIQIDCTSIDKVRVVVDGSGAAQNFVADVYAETGE